MQQQVDVSQNPFDHGDDVGFDKTNDGVVQNGFSNIHQQFDQPVDQIVAHEVHGDGAGVVDSELLEEDFESFQVHQEIGPEEDVTDEAFELATGPQVHQLGTVVEVELWID